MPREVGDGEQQVADLLLHVRGRPGAPRVGELGQLLGHLGLDARAVRPVETDRGGALAEAPGAQQGRQTLGDRAERAGRPARRPLLVGLDPLPQAPDLPGVRGAAVAGPLAEDVGMPPHQLAADRAQRVGDVEVAPLGADPGEEHRLEQEVAELVAQGGRVAAVDGVDDLVGLLDQEGTQRLRRLLPIPGATVLGAQPPHQLDEALERRPGGLAVRLPSDGHDVPSCVPRLPARMRRRPRRQGRQGRASCSS